MFIILHIASRLAGSNTCARAARIEAALWLTLLAIALPALLLPIAFLFVAAPITVLVLSDMAVRLRRRRAGVVLSHLHQAVQMNLSLPSMLQAAAESERGITRRRLGDLALHLESGASIGDAVRAAVPEIDARARRVISVGDWAGRLGPVLGYLADRHAPMVDDTRRQRGEWLYVGVVLLVMAFILLGVCVLIVPKFQEIFVDFGSELPMLTQQVVGAVDFATRESPLWALIALAFVVTLGVATIVVLERWWVGSVDWGAPLRWIGGAIGMRLPGVRSIVRDRAMAQVCFVLAEASRSGLRLDSAIEEAAHLQMPAVWRGRLAGFADAIRRGDDPAEAARHHRLPDIVCGLLGPATRTGDLAGAFDFLARYFDCRFSRAAEVLRGASIPIAIILLGLIVGLIVTALYMPLIQLIDGVVMGTGLT